MSDLLDGAFPAGLPRSEERRALEARRLAHVPLAASRRRYLALDDAGLRSAVERMDRWKADSARIGHIHADGPMVAHRIRRLQRAERSLSRRP